MGTIGYARVSTREQDPAALEWELNAAGAERVFVDDGESSRVADRPQWVACKDYLRVGDTLVVRSLDRLAGTTTLAIQTITELGERGINIKSLTEPDIVIPVVSATPNGGSGRVARTRDSDARHWEAARRCSSWLAWGWLGWCSSLGVGVCYAPMWSWVRGRRAGGGHWPRRAGWIPRGSGRQVRFPRVR